MVALVGSRRTSQRRKTWRWMRQQHFAGTSNGNDRYRVGSVPAARATAPIPNREKDGDRKQAYGLVKEKEANTWSSMVEK
jgi:hypothetical protein